MSRKTHVNSNATDIEERYASWLKMAVDLIGPKNLYLVLGRGTGKTSDYLAERSMDIIYDMPRSLLAFVADTYINAHKNIVPTLIEGWTRKGWKYGVHFVTDERPPSHFQLPYKPLLSYKNTISLWNGVVFNLVSQDQPTGAAGNSYQHLFGDEVKYLEKQKLDKLTPALRGFVEFMHSIYYRGQSFTTDMPQITQNEHDWILNKSTEMDKNQVQLALQAGLVLNEIKKEYYNAQRLRDRNKMVQLQKQMERWTIRWHTARKESTFFYIASSMVNSDVLTEGYFKDVLKSLGTEEFKASVFSFKETLKAGERFYVNLGLHHFYEFGVNNAYYENVPIMDKIEESSLALNYIDHNAPLDAGVDFGNMLSMVIGQERGKYNYILKNMFVLAPESTRELADKFISFFKHHKVKKLNLYHDRSGNQYQKINKDFAGEIKEMIEKDAKGNNTGWGVILMNRNQATIYQQEEYKLTQIIMGEYNPKLPKLQIDKYQCRELKSSMELAKIKIAIDKKGKKTIHKDKSSEKLPPSKLPMYSTNMSDAFKYYIFRPKYVSLMRSNSTAKLSEPGVY